LDQIIILDVANTAATYQSLAELEQWMARANLQEQLAISRARAAGIVVDLGAATLNRKLPPELSVSPQTVMASIQADLTEFGLQSEAAGSIHITQPMKLNETHIEDLRRLASAKSFEASGVAFPKSSLRFLLDLKHLQSVTIVDGRAGNLTDDDLRWLAQMSNLKTLHVHSSNLTDAGIAHLAGAPQLTELSLSGEGFTDGVFAPFRAAHRLESLSISATNLTPALVANLRGLTGLRRIDLNLWYRGDGKKAEAVWPDPNTAFAVQWMFGRPPGEVIDATRGSLEHLAAIPHLRQLTARGNLMVADALTPLTKLSALEWLKVDGRFVSHEDLRHLQVAMPHCHVQRVEPKSGAESGG
jgi:hypothetical protein